MTSIQNGPARAGSTRVSTASRWRPAAVAGGLALAGHGLIHLMGVTLLWRLGQTGDLRYADAVPAAGSPAGFVVGGLWLLATVLFLAAAVLVLARSAWWRPTAGAAVLISVPVLLPMAATTAVGLAADLAVLAAVFLGWWSARTGSASASASDRVPGEARPVGEAWRRLAVQPAPTELFTAELVAHLPEAARRWLIHAIPSGTPLWRSAQVSMRGEIKLGAWRRFTARQVVAPAAGYIWAATAWMTVLPVRGFDRFSTGTGEMRWRLLGVIPVVTAGGDDVARSAAGRLVSEIVLVPTGYQSATWTAGRSADHIVGSRQIDGEQESVELHIGPDGQVLSALVSRWGNPGGAPFGRYPFGCAVHSEQTFTGVTIPATVSAGWWWGTGRQAEGEFFRARITAVSLR